MDKAMIDAAVLAERERCAALLDALSDLQEAEAEKFRGGSNPNSVRKFAASLHRLGASTIRATP